MSREQTIWKRPPFDPYYAVESFEIVSETKKWLAAVAVIHPADSPEMKSIAIYRWKFDGERWKRRANFKINNAEDAGKIAKFITEHIVDLVKEEEIVEVPSFTEEVEKEEGE